MKNTLSILLLIVLLFLPAGLVIGYSYFGTSYPIENKQIEPPSFLATTKYDLTVVFFGFVGCASVCPHSLTKLSGVLKSLKKTYPDKSLGAVFVDVRKQADSLSAINYGDQFSNKIDGTYLPQKERAQVISDFALEVKPADDYAQLLHTDHFFVLEKEEESWRILRVLANSTKASEIAKVLKDNLQ
jgi:protein SCO1/2